MTSNLTTNNRHPNDITASEVRDLAAGKWLSIFRAICPGMFDDAIANIGTHVTCPFHGGVDDFRFIKVSRKQGRGNTADEGVAMCTCGRYPDGFSVIMRATGAPFNEVLIMVYEYLTGNVVSTVPIVTAPKPVVSPEEIEENNRKVRLQLKKLWLAAKPVNPVYYKSRGIPDAVMSDLQDVKTMPSLAYWDKQKVQGAEPKVVKLGSFPANLAVMRSPDGMPCALHRTWLSPDFKDKAPVLKPKKVTAGIDIRGAAIRLYDADNSTVLGLTEGIETALGVKALLSDNYWPSLEKEMPVWATYCANNIETFIIPPKLLTTLTKIVVFCDNDESGTGFKAAEKFSVRMKEEQPGIEVVILVPEISGYDWLDVWVNR